MNRDKPLRWEKPTSALNKNRTLMIIKSTLFLRLSHKDAAAEIRYTFGKGFFLRRPDTARLAALRVLLSIFVLFLDRHVLHAPPTKPTHAKTTRIYQEDDVCIISSTVYM